MNQVRPVAAALLKLGAFGPGAYFSFVQPVNVFVGLIFGVVVLVWHARSLWKMIDPRGIAFIISSSLIWILLLFLPYLRLPGTYGRVALGTILLAIAQVWLLGGSFRRVSMVIPCILGIWIASVWILSHSVFAGAVLDTPLGPSKFAEEAAQLHSIPIWQGAYLLCMFGSMPQSLKARFPHRVKVV